MSVSATPRPLILVADDNPAKRAFVRACLAELDAELVQVEDGVAALDACRRQEFAVLILDINMPGLDGFELARRLSEDPVLRETPIIFQTATYFDELSQIRGYGAGAVDYLMEPVKPAILRSKVRVFLDLFRGKQQLKLEVEERKRQEEIARHLASHDALTGLPNRVLFVDRLQGAMQRAERQRSACAMCYVDIDDFKPVNDTHGHHAGDALLVAFAARLRDGVRREDTVARLGGDEFAVVLEQPVRGADALAKVEKLAAQMLAPYRLVLPNCEKALTVTVSVSVGIALYPDHAGSVDALLRAADRAMYVAKARGKGRCELASAG